MNCYLQDRHTEGRLYFYELAKVTVSPETEFKIDKIVRTRNKEIIIQHIVKWQVYDKTFESWVKRPMLRKYDG
jgi:hypothetical protein